MSCLRNLWNKKGGNVKRAAEKRGAEKRGTDCSVPAGMLLFPRADAAVDRVVCPPFLGPPFLGRPFHIPPFFIPQISKTGHRPNFEQCYAH